MKDQIAEIEDTGTPTIQIGREAQIAIHADSGKADVCSIDAIDAIANVPGLDGVYIGPSDLTLSLGFDPVQDQRHPTVLDAIDRIHSAAKQAGKFAVMHCSSAEHANFISTRNFSAYTVSSDSRIIAAGQQQVFADLALRNSAHPTANGH